MSTDEQVAQWLAWDRNPATRAEVEKLVAAKDTKALEKMMGSRMNFGTAGLRSTMGAGNAHMNSLTILQTAQGLAAYLKEEYPNELSRGIVLGFDSRHNSRQFAEITATVMHHAGIKSFLYSEFVPTPFVAFAVRHFNAICGVMVTASHNPKEYNGYKVYGGNGAQIVSPADTKIAKAIDANLAPLETSWEAFNRELHYDPLAEVKKCYYEDLRRRYVPLGKPGSVRFAYTAMHGVGAPFAQQGLKEVMGLTESELFLVKEQIVPDPEFPTVRFPNPEEGKGALALSIATALRTGSTVILANDPDADRLAVAEKMPDSDEFRVFNGNEIGALLGWWALTRAKREGKRARDCLLITTVVSSSMLRTMAEKEGFAYAETLTGFKFMGNVALEKRQKEGMTPLFAYEEAIGFMWGDSVLDKDGISAAVVMADLATYLRDSENRTLSQQLDAIYQIYGYHLTNNSYVVSDSPQNLPKLLNDIRTANNGEFPKEIAGVPVLHVCDLDKSTDTREASGKCLLDKTPMITFYLKGGIRLIVRGSGTEPKIKWYAEMVTNSANDRSKLESFVGKAVRQLFQPEKYGFTVREEDKLMLSQL